MVITATHASQPTNQATPPPWQQSPLTRVCSTAKTIQECMQGTQLAAQGADSNRCTGRSQIHGEPELEPSGPELEPELDPAGPMPAIFNVWRCLHLVNVAIKLFLSG